MRYATLGNTLVLHFLLLIVVIDLACSKYFQIIDGGNKWKIIVFISAIYYTYSE